MAETDNKDRNNEIKKNIEKNNEIERNCTNAERILIVCTGNTCRSPMAAALARKYMPWAEVLSAGTATVAGLPASIGAMDAMQQMGLSIDDHVSRPLNQYLLDEADLVLTMTEDHNRAILNFMPEIADKVFTLGEFAGVAKSIPDPFGKSVEEYVQCAKDIEVLIQAVAEKCRPAQ